MRGEIPPTRSLILPAAALAAPLLLAAAGCERPSAPASPPAPPAEFGSLRELPAAALPPQTRPRPDPARDSYVREPVHVRIEATVRTSSGTEGPPEVPMLERHLAEYCRRAGHPVLAEPAGAVWRLEGTFRAEHDKTLVLLDVPTAYKYRGTASLRVLDREGREVEGPIDVPDLLEHGATDEKSTEIRLERHMARILWEHLSVGGKTFADRRVVSLIGSLAQDPSLFDSPEAEGGEPEASSAERVVRDLAAIGFPAVHYLLDALQDERVVRLNSRYPGLEAGKLDALRVYHLADQALEEIFQKVSRMNIRIGAGDADSARLRRVIAGGWENEWRRFCPSFRDSPNAPTRRSAKTEG